MNAFDVAREETHRLVRGLLALMLFSYAGFALMGYYHWRIALSLALGTAYTLFNFNQMAFTAARAVLMDDPARARRLQTSRYLMRYVLTGVLVVAAIKLPFFHPVAVTLPLFFPKIILIASGILHRKGG